MDVCITREIKYMATPAHPPLRAGRAYRTKDLGAWGANAPRLAKRLVREGQLVPLAHGLFAHPRRGRFGAVPPSDAEVMRAFLNGGRFVFTGPERWNALGLGTTALFATSLIYNTKRSGTFEFGGRKYQLRRVAFPTRPTAEWFVVDLFENAERAGAAPESLAAALRRAVAAGAFDPGRLREMGQRYGTRRTRELLERALEPRAT
jgi:hypothetical protein